MKESPRPTGNSLFAKETHGGNFGRKSMQTESGQHNTVNWRGRSHPAQQAPWQQTVSQLWTSTILSGRKEGKCCPHAGSGGKHQTAQFEPHEKVYPVSPSTEATEGHGGDEGDEIPTEGQSKATALIPPTYINKHPTPPPESSASPVCLWQPWWKPSWVSFALHGQNAKLANRNT